MAKSKRLANKTKPFSYHLGNFLIIISLFLLAFTVFPIISVYLFPPKTIPVEELKGDYVTIPKISAQAPLIFNVDPTRESIYQEVLKRGVAHAKGTALPEENGTVFLFAHSSGNPLEISNYNTVFLKLGKLEKGDEIFVNKDGKIYKYKVFDEKIVWPTEVKYLGETKDQLIVQTCWPIGTDFKRLLIFATPVK